jgi:2'-5' RNA ligase
MSQRLFVAVDPAPAVRDRLRDALARLRPHAPSAKWVDADSLHLTLAFLGETEEAQVPAIEAAIRAVAARRAPLELRFAGAGAFGGKRPRVLWVGVGGDIESLTAAQKDLESALVPLGYTPEARDFTAHLTLARAREPRGDAALLACVEAARAEDFGPTRVEEMVLYRSELTPRGARYTALARLPFAGS